VTLWLDAQLSPRTADWITANYRPLRTTAIRDLGLRDAKDREIFAAAGAAGAIILTKDSDFVRLLEQQGSPPSVIWLTCGNTSDATLQRILARHLPDALQMLQSGERLVEIGQL
jgi:predicted nuclease of predicted toxin-antitoxin system